MKHRHFSRREFLAGSAILASAAAGRTASLPSASSSRELEYGDPLAEFDYGNVTLSPGPHRTQLEQTHGILMNLSEDSLLRPFRTAAGMAAPGYDIGGWYSPTVGSGKGPTTFGQWMSALSRYYAATRDEATRLKVERLVDAYGKTVVPHSEIYGLTDARSYLYDKLVCGLEDAYSLVGVKPALRLLSQTTDLATPYLDGRAIDQFGPDAAKSSEGYTVPENQFIAWQRGGEERHYAMAKQYMADDFLFGPLANGHDVLPGRHAYSHANALCSAARAYLVLGDETYLKAAANGFRFIEAQSFATGAWGPHEFFVPGIRPRWLVELLQQEGPAFDVAGFESLGAAICKLKGHFETGCGSYAHFKLTRYLLRITKDPHYGDSMERVMYNCALGMLPLSQFGQTFYESNYSRYATKQYFDGYGQMMSAEWPCCSGTLPQLAADYHISAYFRNQTGVFVNLYIPSSLRWSQDGAAIELTQAGDYPLSDEVSFAVNTSRPTEFELRLRIPAWAQKPSLEVNGTQLSEAVTPGTFARIHREWRSGDRIALRLPKSLELKPVDAAHPNLVALVAGPIVLFAIGYDLPKVDRKMLLAVRQTGRAQAEWRSGNLRFLPWWVIKGEVYTTYHDVS